MSAMNDQEDGGSTSNQGPAQPPPPPPIPPEHQPVLPSAEQNPPDDHINVTVNLPSQTRAMEWLQLGVNALLAVIGILAVYIYGGQLGVMKGQLTAANNQLTEIQKQYPELKESADAAKNAADISSAALSDSRKSFQVEQRPYVVAQTPAFNQTSIAGNQDISANVTFINLGVTPARKTVRNVKMEAFQTSDVKALIKFMDGLFAELRNRDTKARREVNSIPNAGEDIAPKATEFSTSEPIRLSPQDVLKLRTPSVSDTRNELLFYAGVISYFDSYHFLYKTEFCYYYAGDNLAVWHICDNHNTMQ
jgi:hypothetical protein